VITALGVGEGPGGDQYNDSAAEECLNAYFRKKYGHREKIQSLYEFYSGFRSYDELSVIHRKLKEVSISPFLRAEPVLLAHLRGPEHNAQIEDVHEGKP
jgi:hypothetical protein